MHPIGTPVMGIELLEYRPHWTSPLCEIGISRRSVYQLTTSREQALGEGNRGRSDAPPRQADPTRQESQRSVSHGQYDCEWCRYDECLVSRARSFESQELMGRACSSSLNRPVRTRMPWWCGEGARKRASLPDSSVTLV